VAYFEEISECVLKGEVEKVKEYVTMALEAGDQPRAIIDNGLLAGMAVVGKLFKAGDMFIPEVMRSAQTMTNAMTILEPLIVGTGDDSSSVAKILMGTVKADVHNIGKDLVSMMLRSSGFEVKDLGVDVPKEKFLAVARDYKPDLVGLSALLTTTLPAMRETVAYLNADESRNTFKIMVGGAPVTRQFADEIGADGYAPDAGSTVDEVNRLLGLD
jgi:5-methyltetrahydrofolate--homocysteine methyltransferase